MTSTSLGADVSSFQSKTPDLTGKAFCFVKATQGNWYVNPKYKDQIAHARSKGLVVGHYHYADGKGTIEQQVDYFLKYADIRPGEMIALDWEDPSISCAEKDDFLKKTKAKKSGNKVLLYCPQSYWTSRDTTSFCQDGLWIAQYNGKPGQPNITHPWVFHQYTDAPMDTSLYKGTKAQLQEWAGVKAAAPAQTKPKVSLKNLVAAAKGDPKASQGHQSHPADVRPVEAALVKLGYLGKTYASDGSFGSTTVTAYAKWQKSLGYSGSDADGIPGETSLKKLASKVGTFTVTA